LIAVFTLSVLAALIVPGLARQKRIGCALNCFNNLKQIGLSFRTWALDNGDKYPMQVSVTNGGAMETIPLGWVYPQFQVMSNELSAPKILVCPQDQCRTGAPSFASSFDNRNISYFVGIDAVDTSPQMLLAGDDNLLVGGKRVKRGLLQLWTNTPVRWSSTRHVSGGNVCLSDGSVQQFSRTRLTMALSGTGMATNRLLMP
jgi:hypothetical protein